MKAKLFEGGWVGTMVKFISVEKDSPEKIKTSRRQKLQQKSKDSLIHDFSREKDVEFDRNGILKKIRDPTRRSAPFHLEDRPQNSTKHRKKNAPFSTKRMSSAVSKRQKHQHHGSWFPRRMPRPRRTRASS